MTVLGFRSLAQVRAELRGEVVPDADPVAPMSGSRLIEWRGSERLVECDLADLKGLVDVKFALEVTNTSDRSCLIDVTDKTRELVIVSGPARIWGSADCVDPKPRMLLLAAGQSDAASLTWKRVRSEPGCPTKGVEAKAGTYRATASILGKTSDEVVLVLS